MTDYLAKKSIEGAPQFDGIDPDEFRIVNAHAVALPLSQAAHLAEVAMDLGMHLFRNRSPRDFVTSDDPVVMHNQYCEGVTYRGVLGWDCSGIQAFWPVSPRETILLYDSSVYMVGRSHRGESETELTSEKDVDQLNLLQLLNARKNIYLIPSDCDNAVAERCSEASVRRPKHRTIIVETEDVEEEEGGSSSIVHMYESLLPIRLSLSCISIRRDAGRIGIHERAVMYRSRRESRAEERPDAEHLPSKRYPVRRTLKR